MNQHLATIMNRETLTRYRYPFRERFTNTQPVSKASKSMQPDMSHNPRTRRFHHNPNSAVNVHL